MYMGNASIIPRNYRKYLYHAYLAYMEANGYRNVLSLKMFGLGLPVMLKEYGLNYEKRHTKQGDTDQPDTERGKLRRLAAKNVTTLQQPDPPDRHLPVFFLSLNSPKVNNPLFTLHRIFTRYHTEIKREKTKGEQCKQSNQKKLFFSLCDFSTGGLITGMSHTGRMPEVKNRMFTLHPLFTTYPTEIKGENRKVNSVNSSFEKKFFSCTI